MASVNSLNLVLKKSQVTGGLSTGTDAQATLEKVKWRNRSLIYNGLRSMTNVCELQLRTSRQVRRKGLKEEIRKKRGVITCGKGMNLVFVGTEVAPWSKTGGLGDVLGGLPPAMAAFGHRVMTISPRYDQYKDAWDTEVTVEVLFGKVSCGNG